MSNTPPRPATSCRRFTRSTLVGAALAFTFAAAAHATAPIPKMIAPFLPAPLVRAVEAPPFAYASGPTLTGATTQLDLPDAAQVDYLCQLALGPTWPRGGYWMACYNGRTDTVIVPAEGAWPSEAERRALIDHEWAHARGWKHENDGRFGRPRAQAVAAVSPTARAAAVQ